MKKLLATMFLSTVLVTGGMIAMAENQNNIDNTAEQAVELQNADVGASQSTNDAEDVSQNKELEQPFKKGEINPYGNFFTGTTYLERLVANDNVWNSSIANVTFEPKARTNWHRHSGGQILLVTAGEGRYRERGKEIQILKKGDVVKIRPGVEHWHGAAPDSMFAHISIEPNLPDNQTTWLKPVKDEEYNPEE